MISTTSAYAIRSATCIARQKSPMAAKDVAEEMDVPVRYLQQVLRGLVKTGILSSSRGVGGGFSLKQPAEDITLVQIVSLFDDVEGSMACPFGEGENCEVAGTCPIHDHWSEVVAAYKRLLLKTTLADLAKT